MANPMHKDLHPLVVMLTGTCNAFTTEGYIRPQWKALYYKYLFPVLGPRVAHASDGDFFSTKTFISCHTGKAGEMGAKRREKVNKELN